MKSIFIEKEKLNIKALIDKCSNYNTISFDVFDTLLKRNIDSPAKIFTLLDPFVEEKFGISNFSNIRMEYARTALRQNPYATLEDIYSSVSKSLGVNLDTVMDREILCEYTLITENYSIKKVYDYCKAKNKKIIAISDMYLSKSIIKKMLKKCGYEIDEVFVSCEEKGGKSNSKLFNIVCQKLNLNKSDWLHIGDSIRADFIGARRAGVYACHIPQKMVSFNSSKYIERITEKNKYFVVEKLINNKLLQIESYYEKFGYSIIGPLLYSYVNWLIEQLSNEGIKQVFFLSRDGYLIKKAFDFCNKTDIRSHYLYVSRRSIRIPYALNHHSFEDIINFLPPTKCYTIRMFLEILGLIPEKHEDLCKKYGFTDLDQDIFLSEIKSSQNIKNMYHELEEDFLENAKREYKVFEKYLNQQGFESKLAIVDIGWNLSMQYFLENLPYYNDKQLQIYGYYLGIVSTAKSVSNSRGFIVDKGNDSCVESVSSFIGLMESVFLAREGTTLCYEEVNDIVLPKLLEYEYSAGDVEYLAFNEIQNGAMRYVDDANNISSVMNLTLNGYNAFLPFKSFGTSPYIKDVYMFSKFRYLSEGISYFADAKSLAYYVLHFRKFKSDILKSRWKIGFMKKMMLIKLPYYKIYQMITKKQHEVKMKKILIIGMTPILGGIETYIYNLVKDIDKSNYQIDFLVPGSERSVFESELNYLLGGTESHFYYCPNIKKHFIRTKLWLRKFYQDKRYDLIYLNTCSAAKIGYCSYAVNSLDAKLITHSHNGNGFSNLLNSLFQKKITNYSNVKLSCSDLAAKWLYGDETIDVQIVPNGVDVRRFEFSEQKRKSVRGKCNIADDKCVIGHVGRFSEQKNQKFFVTISKLLGSEFHFLLIGDGELKNAFIEEINKEGIADKFTVLPSQQDVENYYSAMDIFAMPSIYEGLPIVAVEA